jgi:hypothetical protein
MIYINAMLVLTIAYLVNNLYREHKKMSRGRKAKTLNKLAPVVDLKPNAN